MKFFVDTDIGDDIDDALAIAYALEKGIDIVGVSTVYREAEKRAPIVKKMLFCKGVGNIPVYSGYSQPMSKEANLFGRMNYSVVENNEKANKPEEAVAFMAECADKYGSELCILAMGAQTNIAAAWQKYPEKMVKVGFVAIMGGCFTLQHNEWNIACDPTAAKIVAESEMNLFYVPWNITKEISLGEENSEYITNYYADNMQGYISELVRQWKKRMNYIPLLHDLAMLICATDEKFYEAKEVQFCVIDSGACSGITLNTELLNLSALPNFRKKKIRLVTKTYNDMIVDEFMQTVYKTDVLSKERKVKAF